MDPAGCESPFPAGLALCSGKSQGDLLYDRGTPAPAPLRHEHPQTHTRLQAHVCMISFARSLSLSMCSLGILLGDFYFTCSRMLHPSPDPKQRGGEDVPQPPIPPGAASGLGSVGRAA